MYSVNTSFAKYRDTVKCRHQPSYGSRPRFNQSTAINIANHTGPLDVIENKRVLIIADIENLSYSARNRLGFKVSYSTLTKKLAHITRSCALHAFFSRHHGGEDRWSRYFADRGWIPHPRDIEIIQSYQGQQRLANSDNMILFMSGLLVSRSYADVVGIASGDGTLVCDLAKAIASLPIPFDISCFTMVDL
jgi:hypothetical protein